MRAPVFLALAVLAGLLPSFMVHADDVALTDVDVAPRVFAARQLDDEGRLADALPLYAERARETVTLADRLRYAGALLRARQAAEARAVFDEVLREEGSLEHGSAT